MDLSKLTGASNYYSNLPYMLSTFSYLSWAIIIPKYLFGEMLKFSASLSTQTNNNSEQASAMKFIGTIMTIVAFSSLAAASSVSSRIGGDFALLSR